jgi:hypothetical protein
MFNETNRRRSFNVTIIDDEYFELDAENFTLELQFDPIALELPPSNLTLHPDIATIEILDDDGKI